MLDTGYLHPIFSPILLTKWGMGETYPQYQASNLDDLILKSVIRIHYEGVTSALVNLELKFVYFF